MTKLCKDCGTKERAPERSRCWSCYTKYRQTKEIAKRYPAGAKILMVDIETTPNLVWAFDIWNQNIGINQIEIPTSILCFAAQWYGSDNMEFYSQWEHGQERMIAEAWRLLNEADIVVHYYGSRFDVPHLNREFLQAGFLPPAPFKQIDLKVAVSRRFKFTSNKLQFLSEVLGLEGKEEHEGFNLWSKVINIFDKWPAVIQEDAKARMESYNKRDVELLSEVYDVLLPWIPGHPHLWLYEGCGGCPTCGADALVPAGFATTRLSIFKQFRCTECGKYFRNSRRERGVTIQESVL